MEIKTKIKASRGNYKNKKIVTFCSILFGLVLIWGILYYGVVVPKSETTDIVIRTPAQAHIGEFTQGMQVRQTFLYEGEGKISFFGVQFATYRRENDGEMSVELFIGQRLVFSSIVQYIDIVDNGFRHFYLDVPVGMSALEEAEIVITSLEGEEGSSITVCVSSHEAYPEGRFYINGVLGSNLIFGVGVLTINQQIKFMYWSFSFFISLIVLAAAYLRIFRSDVVDHIISSWVHRVSSIPFVNKCLIFFKKHLESIIFFIVLFLLYSFRTPGNLTEPYLWAEDGRVLIQRAIYDGFGSLFIVGNGFYWSMQRLLVLILYYILLPFSNITLLPQMMTYADGAIITLSVLYFTSNRFEWVLHGKYARFITCIFVILLFPNNASDITNCTTSMPFALFFAAFIIGLDLLCGPKAAMPNIKQTIFLVLMCLSHASAIFIAAFCGFAALRWLIFKLREKSLKYKDFAIQATKLFFIFASALLQTITLLNSGRSSAELDLLTRITVVARNFPVFPYVNELLRSSLTIPILVAVLWVFLLMISSVSKWVVMYCALFSYVMLFISSFTVGSAEAWMRSNTGRYYFFSYQAVTFLACILMFQLYRSGRLRKQLGVIIAAVMVIVSLRTYNVPLVGAESSYFYKNYVSFFVPDGSERMIIPVGPWRPWSFPLPVELSNKGFSELHLNARIHSISQQQRGDSAWGTIWDINAEVEDGRIPVRLWIHHDNVFFPARNTNGTFIVDHDRALSEGLELVIIAETDDGILHRTSHFLTAEEFTQ